jgi:peptide/nickel transport system permease protein
MTTPSEAPSLDLRHPPGPATPAPPARSATFVAQVAGKTFSRWPARIAIGWIALLAILAVSAPFLANSNPYLIRLDGHLSSPLLASLGWVDVTLVAAVVVLAVLSRATWPSRPGKAGIFALSVVAVAVAAAVTRPTVSNNGLERFRVARATGHVSFVINAPIPFSAGDYQDERSGADNQPPGSPHWMGTEFFGGDVLARLIHACRTAMSLGLYATGIAICIGLFIGGLMGYFAGPVDLVGMRLIEIFEAIPTLFLMLTLVALFNGESYRYPMLMGVIGVTGWTGYARYVRAEFLRLRNADFVHAAVAAGLPTRSVVFRHMLPNGVTPVVITASFGIAGAVIAESTLSYLGLGTIDQPSWGGMLAQSLGPGGEFLWWLAVFPGVAIFLTVLSYNLLGEALADALDPKRT